MGAVTDETDDTPEHREPPGREAREIGRSASEGIAALRGTLSRLEKPKPLLPPSFNADAIARKMADQQREIQEQTEAQFEPIWRANREKLEREVKSVELAGELVELQRALVDKQDEMLAMQRDQEIEAGKQQTREWIVIGLAALALAATIIGVIVTVAVAG